MSDNNNSASVSTALKLGVFGGLLGNFALDLFHTLNAYGMDKRTSHKIAMDYMSELGAAMKTDVPLRATVGAIKDGKSGFKTAAFKFNKTQVRNCSAIAKVIYTFEELHKMGNLLQEARPSIDTIGFSDDIMDYIAESTTWGMKQQWRAKDAATSASVPASEERDAEMAEANK